MDANSVVPKSPKDIAIIGLGARGQGFADLIGQNPYFGRLTAIAEPRDDVRRRIAEKFASPSDRVFASWEEFCARPKMCDGVVVATQDRLHAPVAIACLDKGYDLLLEKPMGVSLDECRAIEAAHRRSGRIAALYLPLRYHKAYRKLKEMVAAGAVGRVITVDHLEPIEIQHQAHSYVRGAWGNESRTSFLLMSNGCHDLDYMCYLIDRPVKRVSSFGSLTYFRREHAPAGSTDRCTDGCPLEPSCTYSALKIYLNGGWKSVHAGVDPSAPMEQKLAALHKSPMSRCVWKCDNDVVDHQVVNLEFADDITATFTLTAFSQRGGREIRVHGTLGEIRFNEGGIELRTFGDNNVSSIRIGHEVGADADLCVMREWLIALNTRDESRLVTSAQASLQSHTVVFAAERARREGRVVRLDEIQ
jgi:predicted dehydrogenase